MVLQEDAGGSTRQSWMETSALWLMLHWELQDVIRDSAIACVDLYGGTTCHASPESSIAAEQADDNDHSHSQ